MQDKQRKYFSFWCYSTFCGNINDLTKFAMTYISLSVNNYNLINLEKYNSYTKNEVFY